MPKPAAAVSMSSIRPAGARELIKITEASSTTITEIKATSPARFLPAPPRMTRYSGEDWGGSRLVEAGGSIRFDVWPEATGVLLLRVRGTSSGRRAAWGERGACGDDSTRDMVGCRFSTARDDCLSVVGAEDAPGALTTVLASIRRRRLSSIFSAFARLTGRETTRARSDDSLGRSGLSATSHPLLSRYAAVWPYKTKVVRFYILIFIGTGKIRSWFYFSPQCNHTPPKIAVSAGPDGAFLRKAKPR